MTSVRAAMVFAVKCKNYDVSRKRGEPKTKLLSANA